MNTHTPLAIQPILDQLESLCDAGFGIALHFRFARPTLLFTTYPAAWRDAYSASGLMLHDPVIRWGLMNTGHIRWGDIPLDDPERVMARATEYGLNHGIACAAGPANSRSFAGFCRATIPFSEDEAEDILNMLQTLHDLTLPVQA